MQADRKNRVGIYRAIYIRSVRYILQQFCNKFALSLVAAIRSTPKLLVVHLRRLPSFNTKLHLAPLVTKQTLIMLNRRLFLLIN